jgi:hypothetical protein
MRCPVDNEMLVMADRGGVEIDYCPKCRGVWLDRGELDKIIERSTAAAAPPRQAAAPVYHPEPRASRYRDDDRRRYEDDDEDDHPRGHRKQRRESFLSDIFDF